MRHNLNFYHLRLDCDKRFLDRSNRSSRDPAHDVNAGLGSIHSWQKPALCTRRETLQLFPSPLQIVLLVSLLSGLTTTLPYLIMGTNRDQSRLIDLFE